MEKPICHVRNLRKSALSGYVSEIDAVATGGRYLTPDATGFFDASFTHDLCVTCVNCGSVVSNPGSDVLLLCSDCGQDEFYVVQTVAPPPKRPTYTPLEPPATPTTTEASPTESKDDSKGCAVLLVLAMGIGGIALMCNGWPITGWILTIGAGLSVVGMFQDKR